MYPSLILSNYQHFASLVLPIDFDLFFWNVLRIIQVIMSFYLQIF